MRDPRDRYEEDDEGLEVGDFPMGTFEEDEEYCYECGPRCMCSDEEDE